MRFLLANLLLAVLLSPARAEEPAAVVYQPKVSRDPMVSPEELAELRKAEDAQKELDKLKDSVAQHPVDRKPVHRPRPLSGLRVQGIVNVGGVSYALVNDGRYRRGGVVAGATIVKIAPTFIVFSRNGKLFRKSIS